MPPRVAKLPADVDLDAQLLKGNWLPADVSIPEFVVVDISGPRFARMRANYNALIVAVSTRPAASFMSGFRDAPGLSAVAPGPLTDGPAPVLSVRMASDCMANADACAVFGHALEYEWYINLASLDSRWLRRHVNVGEAVGAAVNVAVFGLAFHMFELIQEGDNTTEGAMVLGRARTADQQFISNRMRATDGFRLCEDTLWFEHSAGLGQGFSDAGSRGYEQEEYLSHTRRRA